MPNSRVFLDIDLDSHRAKYERARAFVDATDLRYGFSSKDITMLGGGEKQRVRECYAVGGNAASPGCCAVVHRYDTAAVAALRVAAVQGRARRPLSVCSHPILAMHQCTRAAQVAAAAALLVGAVQGLTWHPHHYEHSTTLLRGRLRLVRPRPHRDRARGGGGAWRDIARHVVQCVLNPRVLSSTASYDAASNIWRALGGGAAGHRAVRRQGALGGRAWCTAARHVNRRVFNPRLLS